MAFIRKMRIKILLFIFLLFYTFTQENLSLLEVGFSLFVLIYGYILYLFVSFFYLHTADIKLSNKKKFEFMQLIFLCCKDMKLEDKFKKVFSLYSDSYTQIRLLGFKNKFQKIEVLAIKTDTKKFSIYIYYYENNILKKETILGSVNQSEIYELNLEINADEFNFRLQKDDVTYKKKLKFTPKTHIYKYLIPINLHISDKKNLIIIKQFE